MSNLNSNHIVKISDVAFDSKAEILYVTIPFSKTDQLGHQTTLILKRSVLTSVCPVNVMLNYFSMRPNVEGSLLCHMNNQNLTRYQFSKMLRNALAFTRYSPDEFNTHSLRIGAATQSILNGIDEETIMANGRWKSSCYKRYIRLNMLHYILFSGINKDIWVVGSSIIRRAGEHSKIRPTGTCLGLQQLGCQLVWVEMPGMRWENVVPLIHNLINYRGIPFAVIIHCGGNDIGLFPCGKLLFTLPLLSLFFQVCYLVHLLYGQVSYLECNGCIPKI